MPFPLDRYDVTGNAFPQIQQRIASEVIFGGRSIGEMAKDTGYSTETVEKIVDKFKRRGWKVELDRTLRKMHEEEVAQHQIHLVKELILQNPSITFDELFKAMRRTLSPSARKILPRDVKAIIKDRSANLLTIFEPDSDNILKNDAKSIQHRRKWSNKVLSNTKARHEGRTEIGAESSDVIDNVTLSDLEEATYLCVINLNMQSVNTCDKGSLVHFSPVTIANASVVVAVHPENFQESFAMFSHACDEDALLAYLDTSASTYFPSMYQEFRQRKRKKDRDDHLFIMDYFDPPVQTRIRQALDRRGFQGRVLFLPPHSAPAFNVAHRIRAFFQSHNRLSGDKDLGFGESLRSHYRDSLENFLRPHKVKDWVLESRNWIREAAKGESLPVYLNNLDYQGLKAAKQPILRGPLAGKDLVCFP